MNLYTHCKDCLQKKDDVSNVSGICKSCERMGKRKEHIMSKMEPLRRRGAV